MQSLWQDLEEVVRINSYTQNKAGVDRVGRVFQKWFEEIGFSTKRYRRELIGDHLLFSSPKKEGRRVLFLGHLDTVFPPGSFEGFREDESWVYGPGVCDMKGGNLVALEALRAQKRDIYNIDMLLVSDEESGSDDSKILTKELAKQYDECFVFEAAGEHMEVVVARKGVGTFFVDIEGKAAHSGVRYSAGINANLEAAHKLIALQNLTDLKEGTTLNVGVIEGGIGANTISPKAKLTFELRYTTIKERDRVLSAIDEIVAKSYVAGTKASLSGGIQRDVMQESKEQKELLERLQAWGKQSVLIESRGGVSDANIVASCGVATLDGLGPFGDGDHTIDERALKSSFISRIDLMKNYIDAFLSSLEE